MNIHILRYDDIGSTNDEALEQAKMGAQEGVCVVANSQNRGRGREGRVWHSANGGLYFSIVLRPTIEPLHFPVLTLMTSVAVFETVRKLCGQIPDIKWPNDVLVNDKKISGILAETCETSLGTAVIMGIGINITSEAIPEELRGNATSLVEESGTEQNFDTVLRVLMHFLTEKYNRFKTFTSIEPVLGEWSARSSYFRGKEVTIRTRTSEWTGVTRGLDAFGSLLVQMSDGRIRPVTAGDVTAIRPIQSDEDETAEKDVKRDEVCENE